MEVVQVVTSIAEEASGPSYSVPSLCEALENVGARVTLHVLAPAPEALCRRISIVQHERWGPTSLRRLAFSPTMRRGLRDAAASADIIHNNGLWEMTNVYPAQAARGTRCRVITSPRGTFAPWALSRSRRLKQCMWWACQGQAIRDSACLHATADSEYEGIRRAGLRTPVAIIPNGIDIPERSPREAAGPRRMLFLGRIHPVKGVDILIRAWRTIQDSARDWVLEIAGPDNGGHLGRMKDLARSIGAERLTFRGPLYGEAKLEAFRRADLFVLPTHSENFGIAVAEALACGVPAIVSRGAPWAGLDEQGCGWWIDIGEGPLTECLREALTLSREELSHRGERGRAWMERDYSWDRVGTMMHETYLWVLGGGTPPPWVREES